MRTCAYIRARGRPCRKVTEKGYGTTQGKRYGTTREQGYGTTDERGQKQKFTKYLRGPGDRRTPRRPAPYPTPGHRKTPLLCEKGEKRKGHSDTHGHSDKPPGMIRRTMSTREQSGGRATGELRPLAHTSRPSAPNMLKDSDGKAPPLSLHLLQYIPVPRPPVRRETPAGQENPAPGHGLHRVTRPPRRRGIPYRETGPPHKGRPWPGRDSAGFHVPPLHTRDEAL